MELLPFPLAVANRFPNYAPSASRIHSLRPDRRYSVISPYVTSRRSLVKPSSSSTSQLAITADDIRRAAFIELNIGIPYEFARIYVRPTSTELIR